MEFSSTSSTSTGEPAVPITPVAVRDPTPPGSGLSSSDIEAIADVMLKKLKEKGSAEASTLGKFTLTPRTCTLHTHTHAQAYPGIVKGRTAASVLGTVQKIIVQSLPGSIVKFAEWARVKDAKGALK